jgi:hypothetical protein
MDELIKVIDDLTKDKLNVGMYFPHIEWKKLFSEEEAKKIKVYMCGNMDFTPVQHACYTKWITGTKYLIRHNISTDIQGLGLPRKNRFDFYRGLRKNR